MKKPLYNIEEFKRKLRECQSKMSATLEIITPDVAIRYLSSNLKDDENRIQNREVDDKMIAKFIKDIEDKRWEVGEPILFDINGNMIDGQGRCTAVVKSGIPIICWVIRGLSSTAFAVIDCGKKRSLKDSLTTLIIKDSTGKSLKLYNPGRVGTAISIMHNMSNNSKNVEKDRYLTTPEVTEMVRNNFHYYNEPFVGMGKSKISTWQKSIKNAVPASYLAAFYYTNKKSFGNNVDKFINILTSNDNTTPFLVRKFRDDVIENKHRHSFDNKYLNATAMIKKINALFKYYQDNTLNRRKEYIKKDLI